MKNSRDPFEEEHKRFVERYAVLIAKDFSDDPDDPQPIAGFVGKANRAIKELVKQIYHCCSDKKWTRYQKRVACEQLVELAFLSTKSVYILAKEFREPFQQIAEELGWFPCLFPAQAEQLPSLQKILWDEFNLGKRHPLKVRAAPGRKTFSTKTWTNKFLIDLILLVYELGQEEAERDPGWKYPSTCREVAHHVPLTSQNARQWLNVLWDVLLVEIPNPEMHPRLRQLVERPSLRMKRIRGDGMVGEKTLAHNIRADIKAKLGVYLKRMLNDSAVAQITT